jgi:hypothetical protein
MNRDDHGFKPPSLAQCFESPDGFCGVFGWLCGYSGDEGFLDDAVGRFIHQTYDQRAHVGRIALVLLLDRGNRQISPIDAPGVLHLPPKGQAMPFKLLHAKVGLLGFRHVEDARLWQLRLIISTGNWTRETLEDSLDLAWSFDIRGDHLAKPNDQLRQACADLKAAWGMLNSLRQYFDCRVLDAVPEGRIDTESTCSRRLLEGWISEAVTKARRFPARYIDNRNAPLFNQLSAIVKSEGGVVSRNYLGMGSGFYESAQGRKEIPPVLRTIVEGLQTEGLLTKGPTIDVFVNPMSCQAVADALPSISKRGWTVREAGKPSYFGASYRALHAKFIFSANRRTNSNSCNSAWLYLGSGNLTAPGFINRMNPSSGNLEAAVVILPKDLKWTEETGALPSQIVTNLLPVQWRDDISQSAGALAAGNDMPERDPQFFAAPVSYLFWYECEDGGRLRTCEETSEPFEVLDHTGSKCTRDLEDEYHWLGPRPRQVRLIWQVNAMERHAFVPVIDEFGRIAAKTLSAIDIDEAWWQLANFPMPPDDETVSPDGDDERLKNSNREGAPGAANDSAYPVRRMMQLIENIAAKQTAVLQADWHTWCTRLEQSLVQAAESPTIKAFLELGINPLSPLWYQPFRPDFAGSPEQVEGWLYEQVLNRVEMAWKVATLSDLGRLP